MSAIVGGRTDPLPLAFAHWLTDNNSLTQHLKQLCHHFEVEVLTEGLAQQTLAPPLAQLDLLELDTVMTWQREVLLRLDGVAWVYALTTIPKRTLEQTRIDFAQLGTRPLGEILFSEPEIKRGQLRLTRHDHASRAGQLAQQLGQGMSQPLWGRCREFHLPAGSLTVHEVFLPFAEQQIRAKADRQLTELAE